MRELARYTVPIARLSVQFNFAGHIFAQYWYASCARLAVGVPEAQRHGISICLAAALITGNMMGLALATVPLAGGLLAFLRYNFSPASIFLCDCGSLTIGFMLGCFGLIWSRDQGTLVGMALPMMELTLPLLDVVLSIARRTLAASLSSKANRLHITRGNSGSTSSAALPSTSGIDEASLATTGAPQAIPSTTGKPNPS